MLGLVWLAVDEDWQVSEFIVIDIRVKTLINNDHVQVMLCVL